MAGKEPAAIEVIDLTQCEDGDDDDDVNCASTSAAPVETKPLLRLVEPIVKVEDGTCSRAPIIHMLHQAHGQPRRMFREHVETQPLPRPATPMVQPDDGTSSRATLDDMMQQDQGHVETEPLLRPLVAPMVEPEDDSSSRATVGDVMQQPQGQAQHLLPGHVESQPLLRPVVRMVQPEDGTSSRAPLNVNMMQQAQGQPSHLLPGHFETKPLLRSLVAPMVHPDDGSSSRATVGDVMQQPQGQPQRLVPGHVETKPLLRPPVAPVVQPNNGGSSRATVGDMMQQPHEHSPRGHVEATPHFLRPTAPMVQPHDASCSRAPAVRLMQQAPGQPQHFLWVRVEAPPLLQTVVQPGDGRDPLVHLMRHPRGNQGQRRYTNFPLPRPMAPMLQPHNGTSIRAPPIDLIQPAQGQSRPLLRGQAYALRHPERSSTMNVNRGNDGRPRSHEGISNDHCRSYLEQQGGVSEARKRRRLEPIQYGEVIDLEDPIPDMEPEQINTEKNHPSPTTAHHQADADLDRMKEVQVAEERRQRDLLLFQEASQKALQFLQKQKDFTVRSESNLQQATKFQKAARAQQRKAAILQLGMRAASRRNEGHAVQMNLQDPKGRAAPPPPPLPHVAPPPPHVPPSPPLQVPPPSPLHVPPPLPQQQQQHPPNLMSGGGSRLAMKHCGVTAQLTIDNVSFEQAQAIRRMLAGKESEYRPPHKFHHNACSPPLDASLVSQATLVAPQVRALSAPSHSAQAGPSQAPPTSPQAGPFQATSTSPQSAQAGPSQAPPPGPELSQATYSSLTQFLERRKGRVCSTDIKEEDNTTVVEPGTTSEPQIQQPTPPTPPGNSALRAHDEDANMDTGDLYIRAGESGEYVLVEEDEKPASISVADYIKTTTDEVKREFKAILKDLNQ